MTRRTDLLAGKATSLADDDLDPHGWGSAAYPGGPGTDFDGDQLDREERAALRRVAGLSTELEDVTEVEYRQLRLERVVLAAVWTEGTVQDAENSIRELAALAETAGSTVLDGVIQRRQAPDPATFLGKGKAVELRDIVLAEGADTVICDVLGEVPATLHALGRAVDALGRGWSGGEAGGEREEEQQVSLVHGDRMSSCDRGNNT